VLEPGAAAPDFALDDQAGQPVALRTLRGAKSALLVFFPLAFTPVCRGELAEIQQNLAIYQNDAVQVLTISVGPPPHRVWATENGFTFPVLSDFWPHGAVADAYGVLDRDRGYPMRGTFVVDPTGMIVFAECKQPGELRDQAVWAAALEAVAGV
jgi:mycoredoxin-dependent peroxiredoxin